MFELLSVPMFADTDDQDVFEQAAARYLATHYPVERVRALHPYDNPALVVLPLAGGSREFLTWVLSETGAQTVAAD